LDRFGVWTIDEGNRLVEHRQADGHKSSFRQLVDPAASSTIVSQRDACCRRLGEPQQIAVRLEAAKRPGARASRLHRWRRSNRPQRRKAFSPAAGL